MIVATSQAKPSQLKQRTLKVTFRLPRSTPPFNSFAPSHRPRQKLPDSSVVLCEPFGFSCQARLNFLLLRY